MGAFSYIQCEYNMNCTILVTKNKWILKSISSISYLTFVTIIPEFTIFSQIVLKKERLIVEYLFIHICFAQSNLKHTGPIQNPVEYLRCSYYVKIIIKIAFTVTIFANTLQISLQIFDGFLSTPQQLVQLEALMICFAKKH